MFAILLIGAGLLAASVMAKPVDPVNPVIDLYDDFSGSFFDPPSGGRKVMYTTVSDSVSFRPSVLPSVRPSVRRQFLHFFKNTEH